MYEIYKASNLEVKDGSSDSLLAIDIFYNKALTCLLFMRINR